MEDAPVSVQTLTAASSAAVILDSHYKVTAKRVLVNCANKSPLDLNTPFEPLRVY